MKTVIYPRGFLGFDIGLPVERQRTDINKLMDSLRLSRNIVQPNPAVISNTEIEKLFSQYKSGERYVSSFGFREKIIAAALTAFGTSNFYEWCALQIDGPYFTDMHKRFLNDTFNFIRDGRRSTSAHTWLALVNVRELTPQDVAPEFQYVDFFSLNSPLEFRRSQTITDTICAWTAHPGGFEDLVMALHMFFGKDS